MCHIPDIKNLSKNIKNILKPNGMLIFEDPYLGIYLKNVHMIKFMMNIYFSFPCILLKIFSNQWV